MAGPSKRGGQGVSKRQSGQADDGGTFFFDEATADGACMFIEKRCTFWQGEFAGQMAADVKQLIEDEDTGQKTYRYVRTGTNHYSFAFTYDCIAWSRGPVWSSASSNLEYDAADHRRNSILFMDL